MNVRGYTWRNTKAIHPIVSAMAMRTMNRNTTTHAMVKNTTPFSSPMMPSQ